MPGSRKTRWELPVKLMKRELGGRDRHASVHSIYGDPSMVKELDIVNELNGHSGCVNALSWSKSGRLLASGSDDVHVNIHSYLPEDSTNQFKHSITIATGHSANIFSVKFMPGSGDRTIVTAAGDSEVRIFDIEHSGKSSTTSARPGSFVPVGGRRRPFAVGEGVRYLSEGDSNCKVFRSHTDRVKRIVTEASPFFFLTCSEDGEVRQWDIRMPESAYPPAHSFRSLRDEDGINLPVPLISYKKYNLDLNTISCSPSQPHYIALGGAHLHCFLHDRRMLGRDTLAERGSRLPSVSGWSDGDEELLSQATQCVKKFEPKGRKKMKRAEGGHITACKISDAHPNEMVVSWSGDHVYSFDLVNSPGAGQDISKSPISRDNSGKVKESRDRKRKRLAKAASSSSLQSDLPPGSRQRTGSASSHTNAKSEMAIRVQYQNGQTEEIPLQAPPPHSSEIPGREDILTQAQQEAYDLASGVVHLRREIFSLPDPEEQSGEDPTGYKKIFVAVVRRTFDLLPKMDEIATSWSYKVDPSPVEIVEAKTLRKDRGSARRFVQAAASLARVCSGEMPLDLTREQYSYICGVVPAPNERSVEPSLPQRQQFGYDFLKAILLWLDSGIGAVVSGFSNANPRRRDPRFPIPSDASSESIHEVLIPYLKDLASDRPIVNVDANRFEVDENRVVFGSEKDAVKAFQRALMIPFADLSSGPQEKKEMETSSGAKTSQPRSTALRFWAFKVGRGLLMNAGEGIDFQLVDFAYGGLGTVGRAIRSMEEGLGARQEEIGRELEPVVEDFQIVRASGSRSDTRNAELVAERLRASPSYAQGDEGPLLTGDEMSEGENEDVPEGLTVSLGDGEYLMLENGLPDGFEIEAGEDDEDSPSSSEEDLDSSDGDDDDDDEDDPDGPANPRVNPLSFFNRHNLSLRAIRARANGSIACSAATRTYKGHANVKTSKDVNFFGLDDEYVVSGSDDGNLFIWDRKTTQLVNILEGDGEVVNVIQPHPYETMLAVSGIDSTVKIFSPDGRARRDARLGFGVKRADSREFSSIETYLGRRPARRTSERREQGVMARDEEDDVYVAADGLESGKRMHDEYQIVGRNDMARRGGGEGYITRSMLAQLVAAHAATGEGGNIIQLSDGDCTVM